VLQRVALALERLATLPESGVPGAVRPNSPPTLRPTTNHFEASGAFPPIKALNGSSLSVERGLSVSQQLQSGVPGQTATFGYAFDPGPTNTPNVLSFFLASSSYPGSGRSYADGLTNDIFPASLSLDLAFQEQLATIMPLGVGLLPGGPQGEASLLLVAVPEPSTAFLIAVGLFAFGIRQRPV